MPHYISNLRILCYNSICLGLSWNETFLLLVRMVRRIHIFKGENR